MTQRTTLNLDPFLQDLFAEMRNADMALTLEDYGLLRRSLQKSFGLGGWDDFKEICEYLWVKPSFSYTQENFDCAFERFRNRYEDQRPPSQPQPFETEAPELGKLPKIPPRFVPMSAQPPLPQQTVQAVNVGSPTLERNKKSAARIYEPNRYPVNPQAVRMLWRMMRQWIRLGYDQELDLEGTITRIQEEGWWSDVVFRPIAVHRTELVILIDDSAAMRPFQWALQPFLSAAKSGSIAPVTLYRFSKVPQDQFYPSSGRRQAVPLSTLLTHFHQDRTIVLIWSEAGAALNQLNWSYITAVERFLLSIAPCIRQVFWLNPLPQERWANNSAAWIQRLVNGKMFTLYPTLGSALAKARWSDPVSRL